MRAQKKSSPPTTVRENTHPTKVVSPPRKFSDALQCGAASRMFHPKTTHFHPPSALWLPKKVKMGIFTVKKCDLLHRIAEHH